MLLPVLFSRCKTQHQERIRRSTKPEKVEEATVKGGQKKTARVLRLSHRKLQIFACHL